MINKYLSDNKYMTALRYSYILFFIISIMVFNIDVTAENIALILMYIINNQLRYFRLQNFSERLTIFSLIVEAIIGYQIFGLIEGVGGILFIPVLLDLVSNFKRIYSILYFIMLIAFISLIKNMEQVMFLVIEVLPIILLGIGSEEQKNGKLRAQDLYDKLRKKEAELKKANEELESYASNIEEIAVLRERNRISREIHDNVGHALSTIIIQLGAIENIVKDNSPVGSEMTKNLRIFTKKSMEDVRNAVRAMKPREFENYEGIISISEMVKNFKKLTNIEVNLRVSDNIWRINSDQTMTLYRIVQEFLSNSLRHGKATEVNIFLNFTDDFLRVHMKDNGIGCSKVISGIGLKSIKERAAIFGGTMEYNTGEGKGFELVITMDKGKLSIDGV